MRLKPLTQRTEDEQFSRYIRTEYTKEMAMANSSYARAAGIQSEISKVTVTRVASSEVECKRQTNVYKKDMIITVNNISREQRFLRRTMVKYSKLKYQHKMEKQKREKERKEKEQKEREEFEKWHHLHSILNVNDVEDDKALESEKVCDETSYHCSDENNNESRRIPKTKFEENHKGSCPSLNAFDILPPIVEVEHEQENPPTVNDENDDKEIKVSPRNESAIPTEKEMDAKEPKSELLTLTPRPVKPRKHIISFSDLIKLKHSHDTNKLFAMVHILAQKHGVNENVGKTRTIRRNSRIPKRSTVNVISESLRKTASVLYPMKFGYGDHETNKKEKFDFFSENAPCLNSQTSPDQKMFDFGEKMKMRSSQEVERHKTLLVLRDDPRKRNQNDLMRARILGEGRSFSNISLNSTSTKLPVISSARSARSSPNHSRDTSVSWTEAFGLLKSVHNIDL